VEIQRISQFIAWSPEGPTFTASLSGMDFSGGICGPIPASMVARAEFAGARIMEVAPGDCVEWIHDPPVGWTLKAVPARESVDLGRLIVLDPDDPPAELPDALMALLKSYDLRSGKPRKGGA